ncbi:MAG TPA: hypothetical protein VL360_02010 [Gammaproteobacteria bacterium]|jgi:hypothetical protein|nr:hypothetical protein [Gammaproteobacteria bacterium]
MNSRSDETRNQAKELFNKGMRLVNIDGYAKDIETFVNSHLLAIHEMQHNLPQNEWTRDDFAFCMHSYQKILKSLSISVHILCRTNGIDKSLHKLNQENIAQYYRLFDSLMSVYQNALYFYEENKRNAASNPDFHMFAVSGFLSYQAGLAAGHFLPACSPDKEVTAKAANYADDKARYIIDTANKLRESTRMDPNEIRLLADCYHDLAEIYRYAKQTGMCHVYTALCLDTLNLLSNRIKNHDDLTNMLVAYATLSNAITESNDRDPRSFMLERITNFAHAFFMGYKSGCTTAKFHELYNTALNTNDLKVARFMLHTMEVLDKNADHPSVYPTGMSEFLKNPGDRTRFKEMMQTLDSKLENAMPKFTFFSSSQSQTDKNQERVMFVAFRN